MKVRLVTVWLSLLLLTLIISVSCSYSSYNKTLIRMGCSTKAGWYPWEVAVQNKIFQKHNLNIELTWFANTTKAINHMLKGQLDANCQSLDETITAITKGAKQSIILIANSSLGTDKIITHERIQKIIDLKGKTVALEPGTAAHFLLLLGLNDAGLGQKDIKLQPLETTAATEAFYKGDVAAVGIFPPYATKALSRPGSKVLFSSEDYPAAITNHLVVSRKLINEKPQVVQALVNSWYESLKHLQAEPDETYQIMAKRAGITVKQYRNYEAGTKFFGSEESLRAFEPGNNTSLTDAAKQISRFLLENGYIKKNPDLSKLFDSRFVKYYTQHR